MPLFVWALYSTALLQILATPVLAITLLLLSVSGCSALEFLIPSLAAIQCCFSTFSVYSHPAVYIMILPAMGVVSELITAFSHKHFRLQSHRAFSVESRR